MLKKLLSFLFAFSLLAYPIKSKCIISEDKQDNKNIFTNSNLNNDVVTTSRNNVYAGIFNRSPIEIGNSLSRPSAPIRPRSALPSIFTSNSLENIFTATHTSFSTPQLSSLDNEQTANQN